MGDHIQKTWQLKVLTGVIVVLAGRQTFGQCRYEATIIEGPIVQGQALPTQAGGLNDLGQVCGQFNNGFGGAYHAFAWTGGPGIIPLPEPVGVFESESHDISNTAVFAPYGLVVGFMNVNNVGTRAFSFDGIQMKDLGVLGGVHSGAEAVNSQNWIAGWSANADDTALHAVLWIDGKIHDVGADLGDVRSVAWDINSSGTVIGGTNVDLAERAFLWNNGKVVQFPPAPGQLNSQGRAVNNRGHVAMGGLHTYKPNPQSYSGSGFLWRDGQWTDLGRIGLVDGFDYDGTAPLDLNDADVVVGYCRQPDWALDRGFVWQHGIMRDLTPMVVNPTGFLEINQAVAVNAHGRILCRGTIFSPVHSGVAVVLTPLPAAPGDTNCDGIVNIDDWSTVILDWGVPGGGADLNFDQTVDAQDLIQVVENWTGDATSK